MNFYYFKMKLLFFYFISSLLGHSCDNTGNSQGPIIYGLLMTKEKIYRYLKCLTSVISRRFGWKCFEKETMPDQMKNLLGVEMLFHQDSAQMLNDALSWLRLLKRNGSVGTVHN